MTLASSAPFAICAGVPEIRPLGMPPVSVGLPWALDHWTGPGLVTLSVWVMGYPSDGVAERKGIEVADLKAELVGAAVIDAVGTTGCMEICHAIRYTAKEETYLCGWSCAFMLVCILFQLTNEAMCKRARPRPAETRYNSPA